MRLRPYLPAADFDVIRTWIPDERAHALWCAGRFPYPLTRVGFEEALAALARRGDGCPFMAVSDGGTPVGFFCCPIDPATREGVLKFVVVSPALRGRGLGRQMIAMAARYAFTLGGAETLRLSVFSENTAARRCYAAAGFEELQVIERAFRFGEAWWDRCVMVMRKPVTEGETQTPAPDRMVQAEGGTMDTIREPAPIRAERASLADLDELTALRLLYLAEDLGALREADAEAIRAALPGYLRTHLNRDLFVYAVRAEGQIAACAFLLVIEKPMSPRFLNGKTGTVLNVYTRPAHRRRGYGRAVMTQLLADAAAMGLCTVELKATEDGYPLYRAVGFADDIPEYHLMKWKNPGNG